MPPNSPPYQRAWKRAHPELRLAADRRRNREKIAARSQLNYAVRSGLVARPDACQECGRVPPRDHAGHAQIEAHHPDYSRPFEVEWLCPGCHSQADGEPA
jgi:Bacillus phage endonuclease